MNVIIKLAKLGLLALPVVLFLVGVLSAFRTPDKRKGSLRQGLTKAVVLALVLAIVYVSCFIAVRQVQSNLEGRITISLNYAKASRGLNPNGTRFNTYDILSDEVLEKHADWVDEFSGKYENMDASNIDKIRENEIGLVFMQVLEDAGVYKNTPEGKAAFSRFVDHVTREA